MRTALIVIAATVAITLLVKLMTKPKLQHFTPAEFGIWWPLMNADLLRKLDAFREAWGYPVVISPAEGSLGRHGGDSHSQHNVDVLGDVRAVDFFPKVPDGQGGYRYMNTLEERQRAFQIARQVGFTGIGIYTDTQPGNMMHGDVRADRTASNPATWSRVAANDYRGIQEVIA